MSSENGEQKSTIPAKSSSEILSELFSTFHAEPPLIIKKEKSQESSRKHKKSKKKHKHKDKKHKKKEKKRKKSSSSSSDDSEVDLAKILIKQEKGAAEKKIKVEGTNLVLDIKTKNLKKEKDVDDESQDFDKAEIKDGNGRNKVAVKNLKLDSIFESTIKKIQDKVKKNVDEDGEISDSESSNSDKGVKRHKRHRHKSSSKKRSPSSSKDKSIKKLKTEDLRNKIKTDHRHKEKSHAGNISKEKDRLKDNNDKDFYKGSSRSRSSNDRRSRDRDKDRTRDRQRDHKSRSRERHKDPYNKEIEDYNRHRNRGNSFYKDDGFYKSRDRELRDEKWYTRDR